MSYLLKLGTFAFNFLLNNYKLKTFYHVKHVKTRG